MSSTACTTLLLSHGKDEKGDDRRRSHRGGFALPAMDGRCGECGSEYVRTAKREATKACMQILKIDEYCHSWHYSSPVKANSISTHSHPSIHTSPCIILFIYLLALSPPLSKGPVARHSPHLAFPPPPPNIYRCELPLHTLFTSPSRCAKRLKLSSPSPIARTKPHRA